MGQIANKSDGVRQRNGSGSITQVKLTGRCVERREELVGGVSAGFHERIEQGRLACIGVTDQRDSERVAPVSLFALRLPLAFDFGQTFFGPLDRFTDHAFVEFDLLLAGATAHTRTTGLALKVRPAPHQPGRQVLQLG